jgi:hypothetical protein
MLKGQKSKGERERERGREKEREKQLDRGKGGNAWRAKEGRGDEQLQKGIYKRRRRHLSLFEFVTCLNDSLFT